jgi:hypothetical protein
MGEKRSDDANAKSERFNMFISKPEMEAIDKWAWDNRIRSKSEAVRRLCQIGLIASENIQTITKNSDKILEALLLEAEAQRVAMSPQSIDFEAIGAMHLNNNLEMSRMTGELHNAIQALAALVAEFQQDGAFEERQASADRLRQAVQEKAAEAEELYRAFEELKS